MSTFILTALILYNSPIANRLTLCQNALMLDLRNADPPLQGTLITDPIAPDNRDISDAQTVSMYSKGASHVLGNPATR